MGKARHEANAAPRRALFRDKLGQRGSVAVEAAIIFPLLIMLTFGIIEFSMLMRDYTATSSVVRAGARTASSLPQSAQMIPSTVQAMGAASSAMPQDAYQELWIYRADIQTGLPLSADCSSNCVVYGWDELTNTFTKVLKGNTNWNVNTLACPGASDAVGVYLKAEHNWMTGMFSSKPTTITGRSVMQFEPMPLETCRPSSRAGG